MADDQGGATPPEPTNDNQTLPAEQELGEKGEKALEAWKQRARTAEKEAKRVTELETELARFREQTMTDTEKAIEQARKEARSETMATVNRRLVAAEVRAVAGGRLNDPEDAVRFLDLEQFEVGDDGEVDRTTIVSAVDGLLKNKPYLAVGATRPAGDADQGTRTGGLNTPIGADDPLLRDIKSKLGIR